MIYINKTDLLIDLTIFLISSISLFEIISTLIPNPKISNWTAASVGDATAVNPNSTKTHLANGLSSLFIDGKPVFINGLTKLRGPPSWLLSF